MDALSSFLIEQDRASPSKPTAEGLRKAVKSSFKKADGLAEIQEMMTAIITFEPSFTKNKKPKNNKSTDYRPKGMKDRPNSFGNPCERCGGYGHGAAHCQQPYFVKQQPPPATLQYNQQPFQYNNGPRR